MIKLLLAANAVPRRGGQGLNLHHMIETLKDDFDLRVFCKESDTAANMEVVRESPWARCLGRVPLLRRRRDWLTQLADVHFDRSVAARLEKADAFQGVTGQCLSSLQAAKRSGMRTVLDVVTTHIDYFGEQLDRECDKFRVRPPIGPALRQRIRAEYAAADRIRVMSHVAKKTFIERGFADEKVFVATPPFQVDEFPRAEHNDSIFRVCFVGLIEPWKGFHYLIDAFHSLNRAESELVLWGGTGARSIANFMDEQMAQNPRIIIRPVEVRRAGFDKVYGEASVLVLPSLSDGFGYVVGEAMACGLPVIVTSCSGASDLVIDGVNGFVVPPGDAEAIRERLAFLMDSPGKCREMGAAARMTIQSMTREQFRDSLVSNFNLLMAD